MAEVSSTRLYLGNLPRNGKRLQPHPAELWSHVSDCHSPLWCLRLCLDLDLDFALGINAFSGSPR